MDMGCEISPFIFKSLLDEIEMFAPSGVGHILHMLMPICPDKCEVPDYQELTSIQFIMNPMTYSNEEQRNLLLVL